MDPASPGHFLTCGRWWQLWTVHFRYWAMFNSIPWELDFQAIPGPYKNSRVSQPKSFMRIIL